MSGRYIAKQLTSGRHTFNAIYDTERASYPALLGGLRVPQSFDSMEAAQQWADENLNSREVKP